MQVHSVCYPLFGCNSFNNMANEQFFLAVENVCSMVSVIIIISLNYVLYMLAYLTETNLPVAAAYNTKTTRKACSQPSMAG
jgi:hypothetical protein